MSASHPKATELPRGNEMTLRAKKQTPAVQYTALSFDQVVGK